MRLKYLAFGFLGLIATAALAAEINDLSTTDASNTARFPENMAPSAVNNGARALEGLLARANKDTDGSLVSVGTTNAYAVTANQTLTDYYDGLTLTFEADIANTSTATFAADALTAVEIVWPDGNGLSSGDIAAEAKVTVRYDADNDLWQLVSATQSQVVDDIPNNLAVTGDISPSQLTADVDDYSPTGLSTATVLRLTSDAERTITGIAGGADGRILILRNVGTNTIVLSDEDANSTAANRFQFPDASDRSIRADEAAIIQYDSTLSRWVLLARPENGASTTSRGVVEEATEAEMEAETDARYPDAAVLKHHPGVAKAWVNFDGVDGLGTIRDSYNVTSVTDNGTGDYTVNFTTAFADTNYACLASGSQASTIGANGSYAPQIGEPLTGSVTVGTFTADTGRADWETVYVACYGAQ